MLYDVSVLKSDLLATKLHRPSLPANWVQRRYLCERLDEGVALNRPLTLVSAPAGFGKTTCIAEWLDGLDGWPLSWLSLEPADDDPRRFLAYFIAALQEVDENLGGEIAGVLRAGQLPPTEIISTTLANQMLDLDNRFLLVLDDFHVIQDPFILQLLEELLANPPPPLHLVLLTREDPPLPLARLRANNRLTEIRARDLRFTGPDGDRFLNEAMDLGLSAADVSALVEKTEGWIAGLQLAALALRAPPSPRPAPAPAASRSAGDPDGPSAFVATLSGSHRFILGYLTEQVLDQQPQEVRRFLLQTSILDRLNGDLCDAVTGRDDSRALLARLLKANLFLIPLDDQGQWYRYHHLFAGLLRELQPTLGKDEIRELHRRASHWYAGQQSTFVGEAIEHALAAEAYALAVVLLERHAREMIMQGYAKTVNGWVEALPAGWASPGPRTDLAFAWMHLLRGAYAQASPYLDRARATLAEAGGGEGSGSLEAEWFVMRSLVLQMEDRPGESEALARKALVLAPESDNHVRSLAHFALGSVLRMTETYDAALDAYRRAIQHARVAENSVAEMLSTVGLTSMAFEHGQLHLAQEIGEPVIRRIEESAVLPPISSVIYGALGEVHYQWFRLEEARHFSRRALELSMLGGYNSGRIFCRVLLCRLAQIEGDLASAARELQQAAELDQGQLPAYVRQELVAQQVRVYLARSLPGPARLALQGEGFSFASGQPFFYPELPRDGRISHDAGLLYNSSLRLLLYQARVGNDPATLRRGLELADRLLDGATRGQYLLVALETLLLRAQMRAHLIPARAGDQGAHPEGQVAADYVHAVKLAEPEGIVGVFVEQGPPVAAALSRLLAQNRLDDVRAGFVERIIALAGAQPQVPDAMPAGQPEALVEPLTERELEVLRLMVAGLKYKEIGARLYISLNTVRYHVKAIYGKLGVNKRAQAIAKARRQHLL